MGVNISYLINKLLGVQIKGSDVTLPTQIKGSDVNLPVQLTGSNVTDVLARRYIGVDRFSGQGNVTAGPDSYAVTVTQPASLLSLEFATADAVNAKIILERRDVNNSFNGLYLMTPTLNKVDPSIQDVRDWGSGLYTLEVDDTTNNRYKIILREPLFFPNGFRVGRRSAAGTVAMGVSGFYVTEAI